MQVSSYERSDGVQPNDYPDRTISCPTQQPRLKMNNHPHVQLFSPSHDF